MCFFQSKKIGDNGLPHILSSDKILQWLKNSRKIVGSQHSYCYVNALHSIRGLSNIEIHISLHTSFNFELLNYIEFFSSEMGMLVSTQAISRLIVRCTAFNISSNSTLNFKQPLNLYPFVIATAYSIFL